MLRTHIEILGTKPIFFHKFNIEVLQQLTKVKSGSAGNDPEEWKTSFFHDDGKIYMPGSYIMSAMKNGSVNTKVGRGTIQKTWMSAVTVDQEKIYFNREMFPDWEEKDIKEVPLDSNNPVYVDVRMVANPNTKGRNVRYRLALAPDWKCSFSITADDSLVSQAQIKKVIEDTGKLQGLCDGRTMGYGRFDVIKCEFEKV